MKLTTSWRVFAGLSSYSLVAVLAAAVPCCASLPSTCKPPPELSSALQTTPSASVYDAAGAWFGRHNDLKCALAAFDRAVQIQPDSAEAHYNLGLGHAALKQPAEAERQFRLALKNDSRMAVAHASLGLLLLDADRAADAEIEFRAALEMGGNSAPALDHVGLSLAAQRRYSAAIRYWKQALALQPDSPEIVLSIGVATYQDGDAKGAIAVLTPLVKDHPEMKEAHSTLANIYAHEMRFGEAATQYGEVVRLDPKDDVALLAEAKALTSSGAYQEARGPGEEYVRRKPVDPEGHTVVGSIYKTLGEYDLAEKELTQAVSAQPQNAQAQYELGFVLARTQKPKEALPHLQKALALNPTDSATQFQLAGVLRKLGDTKGAADVTETFQQTKQKEREVSQLTVNGNQANAFLQSGQPDRAAELYRKMLALDPRNAHTQYNLALALAAIHDLRGEREALEKAAEFDPRLAVAQSELGLMDLGDGKLASSQKRLEAALAIDPQLAAAHGNLGLIYALKGDNGTAEKMFRQAIEDDPKYVQGYLNLGLTLASRQEFVAAEAQLEHARLLAPGNARIVSALGKVEARLGKKDEAIGLLRKNVELDPKSGDAHVDLAIALADSYDLQGALTETEAAIKLAPESASAQFNRGRILFDLGRTAEAKTSLETACRLAPKLPEPHYYLALVEKQLGGFNAAAGLFQTVVQSQPANVTAWYFLGQCLQEQSKKDEAIAAWRRALAIDPEYTPALWSLTRILKPVDRSESDRFDAQLQAVLKKSHILDVAQTIANNAIASMQAHDWPRAVDGLKDAIQTCGECSAKADLHKSLGLIYCHAGDLDNGERELRLSQSLKAGGDPEIQGTLTLIARARSQSAGSSPQHPLQSSRSLP